MQFKQSIWPFEFNNCQCFTQKKAKNVKNWGHCGHNSGQWPPISEFPKIVCRL